MTVTYVGENVEAGAAEIASVRRSISARAIARDAVSPAVRTAHVATSSSLI